MGLARRGKNHFPSFKLVGIIFKLKKKNKKILSTGIQPAHGKSLLL
jgi:hypothetical protein